MAIDFLQDFSMPVGENQPIKRGLSRVLAPNPSPFTYTGTQTYIVGTARLSVIDPGPDIPAHLDALMAAINGRPVDHILITHSHLDHSPLSRALQQATGAPIIGYGPHGSGQKGWAKGGLDNEKVEAGADQDFTPDRSLKDGDIMPVDGGTLQVLHTPGHTSNHLCFYWPDTRLLFAGDHIMGWSTTVIAPPDGNMTAYMDSLKRLLTLDIDRIVPTHGPLVPNAKAFIESLIDHRLTREQHVIDGLKSGFSQIEPMVAEIYRDTDKMLHPAAARSVLAHMIKLVEDGKVTVDGIPDLQSHYRLA